MGKKKVEIVTASCKFDKYRSFTMDQKEKEEHIKGWLTGELAAFLMEHLEELPCEIKKTAFKGYEEYILSLFLIDKEELRELRRIQREYNELQEEIALKTFPTIVMDLSKAKKDFEGEGK